jgi:hypothetical protein
VVTLLAIEGDVVEAELANIGGGKLAVLDLGFLQAKYIRVLFPDEALDKTHAKTNGIDVPGGQRDLHGELFSNVLNED